VLVRVRDATTDEHLDACFPIAGSHWGRPLDHDQRAASTACHTGRVQYWRTQVEPLDDVAGPCSTVALVLARRV
jgi:hypothetical protein